MKSRWMGICLMAIFAVGCEQQFELVKSRQAGSTTDASGAPGPVATATPAPTPAPTIGKGTEPGTGTGSGPSTNPGDRTSVTESFSAATAVAGNSKVDFLFVVDNSGSMGDDQDRLAQGFSDFANAFFANKALDICTAITTSDRYLGRGMVGAATGVRDRILPCTKPAGSEAWTEAERDAHIQNVITDFKAKVKVGTAGSGAEHLGKSLVTFMHDANTYTSSIDTTKRNAFFRDDAITHVTFLTDELNWGSYLTDAEDIPSVKNQFSSSLQKLDGRKGIKDFLDPFFANNAASASGDAYFVTSLVPTSFVSVAPQDHNLSHLASLLGSAGRIADVVSDVTQLSTLYQGIGQALLNRFRTFQLSHVPYEPGLPQTLSSLTVSLVHASGERKTLTFKTEFNLVGTNQIQVTETVANTFVATDHIEIKYVY